MATLWHTKCARCCEKGVGSDACVEKRPCQICDSFSEEQKKQLATPTYRVSKELQKKTDSPPLIDPADVTVLGQVESKGETSSDRGETPSKKSKKTSPKSPSKKKTSKPTDIQSELKSMDDMWSQWFARLEALFLAKSITVLVEPVQSSDVVVNDRPFVPPLQQQGPRWQSGNTLASHLCGRGSIPVMAVSGKAGSCLPLVGSLQYRTLANYMYWFPLPFQLPVVI